MRPLAVIRRTLSAARKKPLLALWDLARNLARAAVVALAGNPPSISLIVMSAALGYLLDVLPARAAGFVSRFA